MPSSQIFCEIDPTYRGCNCNVLLSPSSLCDWVEGFIAVRTFGYEWRPIRAKSIKRICVSSE